MSNELETSTGVTHPMVLLKAAIDKWIDPERLGKLMDLAERFTANQAAAAYAEAMNQCQAELPAVLKSVYNQHTKSYYAALESVITLGKPVWTKHGFSVSFGQEDAKVEGMIRFVATVTHKGGHKERFQGDYPPDGEGPKGGRMMNPLQGVVSSGSYMQRDMLRLIFCLALDGADQDGNTPNAYVSQEQLGWLKEMLTITGINSPDLTLWLEEGNEELSKVRAADFPKAADHLKREATKKKVKFQPAPNGKTGGPTA